MSEVLIDVVIPNRNKAEFLPRTLASLLNQTEQRWRAIVIDGESSDGSWEILREMAAKDPRFIVRSAPPASVTGLSIYRSWNHGLFFVRAPYFAILTSDDLWEPAWLARALAGLQAHPSAVAAAAQAVTISADDTVEGPTIACRNFERSCQIGATSPSLLSSPKVSLHALLLGPIFSTIHALVFRASVLDAGQFFSEDVGYLADVEYYLHTCLLGDILYYPDLHALFRIYPEQVSSAASGRSINNLWRTVIRRNRKRVAAHAGIPLPQLEAATDDLLARHRFIMTKPNRATLRNAKLAAIAQTCEAILQSPRLALTYLRCQGNRDKFHEDRAIELAQGLESKYAG